MADYCLVTDIEALLKYDFTSSSKPTTAQIEELIKQVSGEFTSVFKGLGMTTDITDTDKLNMIKLYATMKVGFLIYASYGIGADQQTAQFWYNEVKDWLEKIKEKPEMLFGLDSSEVDGVYLSNTYIDGTNTSAYNQDYFGKDFDRWKF